MKCPHCGKEITRKRGNLNYRSWLSAVQSLFDKHVAQCAANQTKAVPA